MRILPSRYSDQSGFFRRKDDLPMEMLSIHFLDALVENDDSIPIHHSRKKIEKTILSITLIRSILLCRTSRMMSHVGKWTPFFLFCFGLLCQQPTTDNLQVFNPTHSPDVSANGIHARSTEIAASCERPDLAKQQQPPGVQL